MVYCTKCGAKNEDDAEVCVSCGASLHVPRRVARRREDECFGLHYGGAIVGIIFGIIILFFGFAWLAGIDIGDYIGAIVVIIVGILIIAGVAYGATRR